MIQQGNSHNVARTRAYACKRHVLLRRCGVSRRVIVSKHDGARARRKRGAQDDTHVYGSDRRLASHMRDVDPNDFMVSVDEHTHEFFAIGVCKHRVDDVP